MKKLKTIIWASATVIVLLFSFLLIENHTYKNAVYSLPLFNSDGTVCAAHAAGEESIYITDGSETLAYRGVNADFMCYLTLGNRRVLLTQPTLPQRHISVRTAELTMELYFSEDKELFVHYSHKNLPALWISLNGYCSYESFLERALDQMTELNDMN